jgi:hypothetical protein
MTLQNHLRWWDALCSKNKNTEIKADTCVDSSLEAHVGKIICDDNDNFYTKTSTYRLKALFHYILRLHATFLSYISMISNIISLRTDQLAVLCKQVSLQLKRNCIRKHDYLLYISCLSSPPVLNSLSILLLYFFHLACDLF